MSVMQADARALPLRDGCVQCVVTSPPYFGLRDYRVKGQIGLESSPKRYVSALVATFRDVRRVLKDDGVVWLNLGDSYCLNQRDGAPKTGSYAPERRGWSDVAHERRIPVGMKPKDLMGIPWRVALALQADGWYLRSDIIWYKPNPMPESITDRPTKSHEYLFLLTKSARYYYDAASIKRPSERAGEVCGTGPHSLSRRSSVGMGLPGHGNARDGGFAISPVMANARTVWTIATMPYPGAHFATMPVALVEPCILAGSRFGDLVLDPFSGAGTVLAVAERLGRRHVGIDLNLAYHELAKERIAQRGFRWDLSA